MAKILPFPNAKRDNRVTQEKRTLLARIRDMARGVISFLWVVSVLTWPVSKWFIRLDLLFVILKISKHSNNYYVVLHMVFIIGFTAFVKLYKPKNL